MSFHRPKALAAIIICTAVFATGCSGLLGSKTAAAKPPPQSGDAYEQALANECFDGNAYACDELFEVTAVGSELEAYGDSCGGRFVGGTNNPCSAEELGQVLMSRLGGECQQGDEMSCMYLWAGSAEGSEGERFAGTCAGRAPSPPPPGADLADTVWECVNNQLAGADEQELAESCEQGSGRDCDRLYFVSEIDSRLESYGDSCGGRFGDTTSRPTWCAVVLGDV